MLKLLLLIFLYSSFSAATEVDSYTGDLSKLQDTTRQLDLIVNEWIKDALTPSSTKGCNERKLIKSIARKFKQIGWSKFELRVSNSSQIDKIPPTKNNVYQDFAKEVAGAGTLNFLSPLLRIQEHYVGADKFSHFFNEGFNYYKKVNYQRKTLEQAFAYGDSMENGLWGKVTMGIYSYADLAANYSGFLFYSQLLRGPSKYFICDNNKSWRQVRTFSFRDYIDSSWDERINCNSFRNQRLEDLFNKRVNQLPTLPIQGINNPPCPVNSKKCNEILDKYSLHKAHIISPKCI